MSNRVQPPTQDAPVHGSKPSAFRRFRTAGARWLKRVPGGALVLVPCRRIIRLYDFIHGRLQVEAKLPKWHYRAYRLMEKRRFAEALELYSRILAVDPTLLDIRICRAAAAAQLNRDSEALVDCQSILNAPQISHETRIQLHQQLGITLVRMGELDRALGHWFRSKLLRHGVSGSHDVRDETANDPEWFDLLLETYIEVAEFAINTNGAFVGAAELYRQRELLARRYADWLIREPSRTLFLSADWIRAIGHQALLDVWVKLIRMGWIACDRAILHAPPRDTANAHFLDYFKPHLQITASNRSGGLGHISTAFGHRVTTTIPLPDGTTDYFCNVLGVIQKAWEDSGRGPILSLTDEDRAFGERTLAEMGLPRGAWFVCLHVRSPGFHRDNYASQTHRNATIQSYVPAIREIVRRGGWVIRMGDATMEPLPTMPGVIDYARGPHKSKRMDVFLFGASRFFVGVCSGPVHVPPTFGVPVLTTNWISYVPLAPFNGRDLCLPKLMWSERDGRMLNFAERFTDPVAGACQSGDVLHEKGWRVVDNTAEEISEAVIEMMDRLDGASDDAADERLHARFENYLHSLGIRGSARIGTAFLRRYEHLIPAETPLTMPAAERAA